MDDNPDPLLNFFTDSQAEDPHILYRTLGIAPTVKEDEIKSSYRKSALKYHPDKHASKSVAEREEMSKEFQKVGFAYAVLSDPARRKRYDSTGRTDESPFGDAEEMGWDAYFETMFQRIDRAFLDEHKAKYQGSQEEIDDLISAYNQYKGDFASIVDSIPHSEFSDEDRLKQAITTLISAGKLKVTKAWTRSSVDAKASEKRGKKAAKEAIEAEKTAKELGIWDEFYGDGKKGSRKTGDTAGKNNAKAEGDDGEDALKAIMLKRQRERGGGLNALAAKYAKLEEEGRKKRKAKGKKVEEAEDGMPDISDADFEALQAKLMANKAVNGNAKAKKGKA